MHVTSGGLQVHVAEDGDPAAAPVLLVHGIIGSRATWEWLLAECSERFRVLRLDLRGHGRSDRAPGAYTADGYVADALEVLERIGRPCVMVGHSLGGAISAAIAQRRPDLLAGVVLEDPPLGRITPDEAALDSSSLLDGFRFLRDAIPQVQQAGMTAEALVELISSTPHTAGDGTFADLLVPDGVASMAASLLEVDATVLDPVLDGSLGTFLDPAVPFGVPALVIAADPAKPDAVASPAAAGHYAAISASAGVDVEVRVVRGAGHSIHNERVGREPFRAALAHFLDQYATT